MEDDCLWAPALAATFPGSPGSAMKHFRLWAPVVAYAGLIWIVGGLTSTPKTPSGLGLDKVAHFTMYGGLGFLLGRAWSVLGSGRSWIVPVLLALLLGAADELRQATLSTRSADVYDWVADAAGAATGFMAALWLARRRMTDRSA